MSNEEKKEYLLRYKVIKKRIRNLKEQLISLRQVEESAKIQQLSDMPKGSSRQKDLSDLMVRIEELQEKINDEIVKSLKIKVGIEESILNIKDEDESAVLRMRYIELMDWIRISHEMKYSKRHTLRIHDNALKNLKMATNVTFECDNM